MCYYNCTCHRSSLASSGQAGRVKDWRPDLEPLDVTVSSSQGL